jgi:fructose-1,6-bisphosphatase II / sedoheptulose-1,7-bisphosphatase
MSSDLSLEFLRVVEQAAIACAHTMGQGDGHKSDQAAVEAMRRTLDSVPIEGTIVMKRRCFTSARPSVWRPKAIGGS